MARDDRILPETRWLAAFIIPFLVAAFVLLYVWPNDTGRRFRPGRSNPPRTQSCWPAAYAGAPFTRVVQAQQWHLIKLGFLPVTAFASLLGIATILHWDRFNHSHVSFFAWAALYFTTPFLVIAVWLRNRRTDPAVAESNEVVIPQLIRLVIGVVGVGTLAVSLLLFLRPDLMIRLWPWMLTPLTARVVGAMFALPAVVGLGIAGQRDLLAGHSPGARGVLHSLDPDCDRTGMEQFRPVAADHLGLRWRLERSALPLPCRTPGIGSTSPGEAKGAGVCHRRCRLQISDTVPPSVLFAAASPERCRRG